MSSHSQHGGGHGGGHGGHDHAPLITIDTEPGIVNSLKNGEVPLSVDWSDLTQWAQAQFINSPWAEQFLRIVNSTNTLKKPEVDPFALPILGEPKKTNSTEQQSIAKRIETEPALRTYLLYLRDLSKRALQKDAPLDLFTVVYWDAAQEVPDNAEGFAGLWSSLDSEYTIKQIDAVDQRLESFFKFCVRATSHEQLHGHKKAEKFSSHVAPTLANFDFAKIAFTTAGFDEALLHHELESLKVDELLSFLFFVREKLHTFSNSKQRHIADEIVTLTEAVVAKKMAAAVMEKHPENVQKAGSMAATAATMNIWKAYAEAHHHGTEEVKKHLSHLPAHDAPKTITQKIAALVKGVFNHPTTRTVSRLGGISEAFETALQLATAFALFGRHGKDKANHEPDDHKPKH